MKRFTAMLLCVLLIFSLAACGDSDTNNGTKESSSQASSDDTGSGDTAVSETADSEGTETAAETSGDSAATLPIADNAVDFVKNLKAGWSLGNTMDANGSTTLASETSWGAPMTDTAIFAALKEYGFSTVRIPTSWGNHCTLNDDGSYTIDPEWMARVTELVDAALDAGLYVIINSHHDNDYYYPTKDNQENALNFISSIWSQIAENFKDYDERLVFESMNEPRLADTSKEWWFNTNDPDGVAAIECINACNQKFVDVVRAAGGFNETRFLAVPSHAANGDYAINGGTFVPPTDTIENHIIISVHAYSPYNFCMNYSGGTSEWNADSEMSGINSFLDNLKTRFIDNGYGVYIGETGCTNKDNVEDRVEWCKDFTAAVKEHGMAAFWWDNMGTKSGDENFGLFSRYTMMPLYEDICSAFTEGFN